MQGLPLSLSGVKRIMTSMDWGDATDFVTIGAVGVDEVRCSRQGTPSPTCCIDRLGVPCICGPDGHRVTAFVPR